MIPFHVRHAVTLFFETSLCKYGTWNTSTTGSTTGMNGDMPLIVNNYHAIGVTDEVRGISWFYKQR